MEGLNFDSETLLTLAMVISIVLVMRFLPRFMAGVPFVEPAVIKRLMDEGKEIVVLDVRSEREFNSNTGYVPGAINIPGMALRGRLKSMAEDLEPLKNVPVFVTCRSENRSPGAARVLRKAGFSNVAVLKGGMKAWNRAGMPVEG